ncbi:MAG: hypothetical protein WC365_07950 [Candidatus Babeliales bacterium]|jgi:hypothetical protein
MKNNDIARFYTMPEIRKMYAEGTLSKYDLIDLAAYNANLFAYKMLQMPFPRFSPMQERILDTFYNPENFYKELLLICGRKSGKSLISSILVLFEVYKKLVLLKDPHEYYGIPNKKKIFFQLLASNREQAQSINFDYIRSFASTSPYLNQHIHNSTNDEIEFDKHLTVKVYNCSARSARGESAAMVLLDEAAHWIDNKGNLSGTEVYTAIRPNLQVLKHQGKPADSKMIVLTSPAGRQGIAWDLFRYGNAEYVVEKTVEHGTEGWRCVFQAPTWLMNPKNAFECKSCEVQKQFDVEELLDDERKLLTAKNCVKCASNELRIEWLQNSAKFAMEYGAEFCDVVSAAFSKEKVMACIDPKMLFDPFGKDKETPRVISLDPSLTGDAFALVMGRIDDDDELLIELIKEWRAFDRDHPIQLKLVQDYVEQLCSNFYISHVILDQFQSASTVQALQDKGLPAYLLQDTQKLNSEGYERMGARINSDPPRLKFPKYDVLINELCFIQRKAVGKTVRYEASINSSDNITDAIARMTTVLEKEGNRKFTVERL